MEEIKDRELEKHIQIAIDQCKNDYARTYLSHAIEAWLRYGKQGLSVQLLYALNNMNSWRGEQARETKAFFKAKIKELDGGK